MKKLNVIPVLFLLVFTISCTIATGPLPRGMAKTVPNSRVFDTEYLLPSPNTGVVTITRDGSFLPAHHLVKVFIDGKTVVSIGSAQKVVLYLKEGKHIFSVQDAGFGGKIAFEIACNIEIGEKRALRIGMLSRGDFYICETAF